MKINFSLIKRIFSKQKYLLLFFFIFLIPRLIGLHVSDWVDDSELWDVRSDLFIKSILEGDLAGTYQKYHPGVTLMWIAGTAKRLFYTLFEFFNGYMPLIEVGKVYPKWFMLENVLVKLPLVLIISFLLAYSFILLKKLNLDVKYLLLAGVLLSLEPFYLGVTRFFHLSGIESAFMFSSFISFIYFLEKKDRRFLYITGILLGLGISTKLTVLILIPLFFFLYLINALFEIKTKIIGLYEKKLYKKIVQEKLLLLLDSSKITLVILGISSLIFVLIFPAVWAAPFETLNNLWGRGIAENVASGRSSDFILDIKALFYVGNFFLKSSFLFVFLFIIGVLLYFFETGSTLKRILSYLLIFILYYNIVMIIPSKLNDRYLANLYPYAALFSAFALFKVRKIIKIRWLLIFTLLYYIVILFSYYPSFSAFYSEAVFGQKGFSSKYEVRNTGEFYYYAVNYLNEKDGEDSYNKSLVVGNGRKVRSMPGYFGTIYTESEVNDSLDIDYYLFDYLDIQEEEIKDDCNLIKTFGPRYVLEFDYLYLFECR